MSNTLYSGLRLLKTRAYAIGIRALEETGLTDKSTSNALKLLRRRLEKFGYDEAFKITTYSDNKVEKVEVVSATEFFLDWENQLKALKHTTRKFTGKFRTVSRVETPDGKLIVVEFNR